MVSEPGLVFRYASRLIADGAIDVAPLLSHTLPIERSARPSASPMTGPTTH